MMIEFGGEELSSDDIGSALEWSEEDIDALIGIDADGNIDPAVLTGVLLDAQQYPELFGLIEAEQTGNVESA